MEGTGSYDSFLARYQRRVGVEVDRPDRQKRRRAGKSDPLNAIEVARAALRRRARGIPKSRDSAVEATWALVVAKRSARQAGVKALIQRRHLGYRAPEQLRCRLKGLSVPALVAEGIKFRPTRSADPVTAATTASLSPLARRIRLCRVRPNVGPELRPTPPVPPSMERQRSSLPFATQITK